MESAGINPSAGGDLMGIVTAPRKLARATLRQHQAEPIFRLTHTITLGVPIAAGIALHPSTGLFYFHNDWRRQR